MSTIGPGSSIRNGEIKFLSRLGLGGFGEVFLAQTSDGLKAVKVVDTAIWSEEEYKVFNAMLMSEASFLSTLRHPALPRSAGFFAEGSRYYLVMDWVQGHTLEQHVERQGPLVLDDLFGLIGCLVDVLQYLHWQCDGVVVFGDLKPANVLRTSGGSYRLVDLGLVSKQGTRFSGRIAVFSPRFSAPERSKADASHPSQDIYSLGATVFFAMTGREPAPGLSGRERERAVKRLLKEEASDWGAASTQSLQGLLYLLIASLDSDPSRRPDDIRAFAENWEQTRRARAEELEALRDGPPDEIVRLLYENR